MTIEERYEELLDKATTRGTDKQTAQLLLLEASMLVEVIRARQAYRFMEPDDF